MLSTCLLLGFFCRFELSVAWFVCKLVIGFDYLVSVFPSGNLKEIKKKRRNTAFYALVHVKRD